MKTIEDLDQGTIRRIDWQELLPGVLFFRALTLAFRVGPIAAGTFLIILMMALTGRSPATGDFLVLLFKSLVCSFTCHSGSVTIGSLVFSLAALFLWLFLARRSAVRLVTTQRVPLGKGLKFACRRYTSVVLAAALPLAFLLIAAALSVVLGKTSWGFACGLPVLLGFAWLAILLGVGLLIGLPMLAAAVAIDNCDGFDAFSRVFAYIFQRPFHTLLYLLLAAFFGAAGFFVLQGLVFILVRFVDFLSLYLSGTDAEVLVSQNIWSLLWWTATVMLPYGFLFGYVCHAGVALYLLLRKNLDGVAFDVIYADSAEPVRRLRPILQESEGVPEFAAEPADEGTENAGTPEDETKNEEPTDRA